MTPSAVVQGVAIGLLVAVLFSAVPLLDVRRVKPSLLLRDSVRAGERDWVRWAALGGLLASLVLIAELAGGLDSDRPGGLGGARGGRRGADAWWAPRFIRAIRPLASSRSVALRHAVLRLSRPGNQTRAVLLVGRPRRVLHRRRPLAAGQPARAVLGDARRERRGHVPHRRAAGAGRGVGRLLETLTGQRQPPAIPVLRARVTAVTGREVTLRDPERGRRAPGRPRARVHRDLARSPPAERTRDRGRSSGGRGGPTRPRSRSSKGCATGRASRSATWSSSTCSAGWSSARVTSRAGGGLARCAAGRLHVRVPAGTARQGAGDIRRAGPRAGRPGGARPPAAGRGGPLPERLGDRPARDPADRGARAVEGDARRQRGRRPGAVRRRPDPDRVGVDDAVPADLRSRDLPHARRRHAAADGR